MVNRFKNLINLWRFISPKRHKQFVLLIFLIIIASISEMVSLGAVIPFLGVLTDPSKVYSLDIIKPILKIFKISTSEELLFTVTILFAIAVLLASGLRIILLWISNLVSFATGADLSNDVYRKTLYQPYHIHVARNSSEIISGITGKVHGIVYEAILPIINIISTVIMILSIVSMLVILNPIVSISAFLGFSSIYGVIAFLARKRIERSSFTISSESTLLLKSLQEGLGGIRDILLDGSQDIYCEKFKKSEIRLRRAYSESSFISESPRFAVEGLGILLISFFAYFISQRSEGLNSAIPTLGVLAMGAQRLLPVLQQGYSSWTRIKNSEASLIEVLKLLNQPLPSYSQLNNIVPISFRKNITIKEISFKYNATGPQVLSNLNFEILKGSRVGFIGTTGSGKSTLLDIIMALLEPTEGHLIVDSQVINQETMRSWQAIIAHVPQSIYLSDSTITENIAFGIPVDQIDLERVKTAAKKAQIHDHIQTLKDGYQTYVGERGVRLSGGQRQRIGIARALYKNASVIIFDEATSALDNETEKAVMDAINSLGNDLTILIIAHRLSTVKNCDKIIELSKGEIVRIGSYSELFSE